MKKILFLILILSAIYISVWASLGVEGFSDGIVTLGTQGISKPSGPIVYEAFNVTDNGGEAFRVTDNGGEDFNVK